MFSYLTLAQRIPAAPASGSPPAGQIRVLVDRALVRMDAEFEKLYSSTGRPPNHDQLKAIVGGLPGLALEARDTAGARIVGHPPRREDGHWREGFIVLPMPPPRPLGLRWLD